MKNLQPSQNRREFFAAGLRYTVLSFMTVASGLGIAKRRRLVKENKCISVASCRDCGILQNCKLPRAISAREVLTGGKKADAISKNERS